MTLSIISTPIGNLEDISARALSSLKEADVILCEDTRRSSILLNHYEIKKKCISYHKFKEKEALEAILSELKSGKTYALISDAGTPCINDPGQILVNACRENGIPVTAIPGPCSVIQAVVLSGFDPNPFQFVGFLPKNPKNILKQIQCYPGTTVAFESPERLLKTLKCIANDRKVAVVREMTKKFEECRVGTAEELIEHFSQKAPKGEIVLVVEKGEPVDDLTLEELVQMLQELHGLSLKEAIKQAAHFKGVSKRDVYKKFHHPNLD